MNNPHSRILQCVHVSRHVAPNWQTETQREKRHAHAVHTMCSFSKIIYEPLTPCTFIYSLFLHIIQLSALERCAHVKSCFVIFCVRIYTLFVWINFLKLVLAYLYILYIYIYSFLCRSLVCQVRKCVNAWLDFCTRTLFCALYDNE